MVDRQQDVNAPAEPLAELAGATATGGPNAGPSDSWLVKRLVDYAASGLLVASLVGELVIVVLNVLLRKFGGGAIEWLPEISQLALSMFAFIGGASSYSRGSGFYAIGYFVDRLPERWGNRVRVGVDALIVFVSVTQVVQGWKLLRANRTQQSAVLEFSESWIVWPLVIGSALFVFYGICKIRDAWRGLETAAAVVVVWVVGLVIVLVITSSGPFISSGLITPLLIVVFAFLLVAGVPIGFVLITTTVFVIATIGVTQSVIVPQTISASTASFLFVAVPFFVLAGLLLASSGVSERIASFIASVVGNLPGGFYHVIVLTMYLFSGLSGSKLADTVAIGQPLGDMLERYGYNREEGAAVLAASAIMGETVPPSLAIIILGSVTSLSIGTMFIAGLLPAAVMAVCMMAFIFYRARKSPRPVGPVAIQPWSAKAVGRTFVGAVPGLLLPVLLVGGIVGGYATPTEISSFAVLYGVLLALGYRTTLSQLWHTVQLSLHTAGMVLFLLSAAAGFSWLLAYARIPQDVADWVTRNIHHGWLFMLLSIAVLIVFGAVLEGAAALIILAPLLLPVAEQLGINPLQYGLVLIISMGIGTHIPPIGVGMYVACGSMSVPVERVTRRFFSYLGVLFIGVLLIAFVSSFTTVLPHLFGKS